MDLAQPLSTLIPSIDADVLTVLARTEAPLTGRKVAALARRGSQPGVQAILDRLVDHGIVIAQPAGPAVLYTLNRDHLLAEAVLIAVTARETLLARLREQMEGWSISPAHGSLFGSAARGEAGPDSDLDILVVRPDDVAADDQMWAAQLGDLERRVANWTGNQLAWFETDRAGLAKATSEDEPLLDALRTDAVHLTGVPIGQLITPTTGNESSQ
jgi:predicted nucleotidyltransferase